VSRAFAPKDDPPDPPPPTYALPDRSDAGYDAASAAALLHGARIGETASAEETTGYRWGDATLIPHVERILAEARNRKDDRLEQVAERFLKAAGAPPQALP
jgi:hypothetical protein